MNANEIIRFARDIKTSWNTNDPYLIAERLGIIVMHRTSCVKGFTAQTFKMEGYPTIISINDAYTDHAKEILCAHELGHALLHENCINHFAVTSDNVSSTVEKEANLFAIALLTEQHMDVKYSVPLNKMDNYLLKSIIDFNLEYNNSHPLTTVSDTP